MSSARVVCVQLALFLILAASVQLTSAKLERQCGCFPDWVQCDNGRCIPKDRVCDGHSDCQYGGHTPDNSDERDCGFCPSGFTYLPSVKGCYHLVKDNLEWSAAGLRCKYLHPNAHLLIIDNAAEQEAIKTWMNGYSDGHLSTCTRYSKTHSCKEMFWTAGQRIDLHYKDSSFAWKYTPGTGSCCGGPCMYEMKYKYWGSGEPNNGSSRDAKLNPVSPKLPEKCIHICRGWYYKWNDGLCEMPACSICEVDVYTATRVLEADAAVELELKTAD